MIIDLHCDLLGCIEQNPKLNFLSKETNCSIKQLKKGNVNIQTLAVSCVTKKSSTIKAYNQIKLYQKLLQQHQDEAQSIKKFQEKSSKIHFILAIENASCLFEETEPLIKGFKRFDTYQNQEKFLYVSLTWNCENRFGGGCSSQIGLKKDGISFLNYLDGKNIAIDLSHSSDNLAYDILNTIEKKHLDIIPIASHSNFRAVTTCQRNLPDDLVKAIVLKQGLIGLNFVRRFVGDDFGSHISHAIDLKADNGLCLGSDFYGGIELENHLIPGRTFPTFQKKFCDSSTLPSFITYIEKTFSKKIADKISYKNAYNFLVKQKLI